MYPREGKHFDNMNLMEGVFYSKNKLWSIHSDEVKAWKGKYAKVTCVDGGVINGIIREIRYAANVNLDEGVAEHLWVDILVDDKRIAINEIDSLEIK